jgi:hypothetical protein
MRSRAAGYFAAIVLCLPHIAVADVHQIGFDPRIELFSIIFRLAGNPEYAQARIPAYNQAIDGWFGRWRDHPAVRTAREFRQNYGVSYDAVMSLAIHVSDVETLQERVPFDQPGILLDSRWRGAAARRFLDAARRFVADTQFVDFLVSQQSLVELTNERMRELADKSFDSGWFERFFGPREVRFRTVPALANGGNSYGPRMLDADGVLETYAILGLALVDDDGLPRISPGYISTMVHEYCHSHANPLIDLFAGELDGAGQRLFEATREQMRAQAYSSGRVVLYETLVRAATVRYFAEHEGAGAAERVIEYEHGTRSFLWTGELAKLLGFYERDRESYPTLESFMPRVVDFLNMAATDPRAMPQRYEESRPNVVAVSVPEGAPDVDPKLTQIVVRFDRRMSGASSVLPRVPDLFPAVEKVDWDDDLVTCTITVALEPDRSYELYLNAPGSGNFASDEGVWLRPVTIWFHTGAGESEPQADGSQR